MQGDESVKSPMCELSRSRHGQRCKIPILRRSWNQETKENRSKLFGATILKQFRLSRRGHGQSRDKSSHFMAVVALGSLGCLSTVIAAMPCLKDGSSKRFVSFTGGSPRDSEMINLN